MIYIEERARARTLDLLKIKQHSKPEGSPQFEKAFEMILASIKQFHTISVRELKKNANWKVLLGTIS